MVLSSERKYLSESRASRSKSLYYVSDSPRERGASVYVRHIEGIDQLTDSVNVPIWVL